MMMSKHDLDALRAATADLRSVLDESETVTAPIELLVYLAMWVSPLLDELERLSARDPDGRPRIARFAKMDSQRGLA